MDCYDPLSRNCPPLRCPGHGRRDPVDGEVKVSSPRHSEINSSIKHVISPMNVTFPPPPPPPPLHNTLIICRHNKIINLMGGMVMSIRSSFSKLWARLNNKNQPDASVNGLIYVKGGGIINPDYSKSDGIINPDYNKGYNRIMPNLDDEESPIQKKKGLRSNRRIFSPDDGDEDEQANPRSFLDLEDHKRKMEQYKNLFNGAVGQAQVKAQKRENPSAHSDVLGIGMTKNS